MTKFTIKEHEILRNANITFDEYFSLIEVSETIYKKRLGSVKEWDLETVWNEGGVFPELGIIRDTSKGTKPNQLIALRFKDRLFLSDNYFYSEAIILDVVNENWEKKRKQAA
jgi:hypothetical protein